MTASSPARTRSSATQGYKMCREHDVHATLLKLDNVASGIKTSEGEEGIKMWLEWKEKGILSVEVGNNLVKLSEIIGISTKTCHIDDVFQAIVDRNPALKKRMQLRRGTMGTKTSMRYKLNSHFDKKVKAKAKAKPSSGKSDENVWKKKTIEEGKKQTKVTKIYDIMDSDIEDDGNTTPVVEPDQDAGTQVHGTSDGTEATRTKAKEDVRQFFKQKLKEVPEASTTDGKEKQAVPPPVVNQDMIENYEENAKAKMTTIGNDLTQKLVTDLNQKIEEKLSEVLITFEKKMETVMKTSIENYMTSSDFKHHEAKVISHIDTNVPNQFQQRVSAQFNELKAKFDKASASSKYEMNYASQKMISIKNDYELMRTKLESSKSTAIDTVRKELENIGDEAINEMLDAKDHCLIELNTEIYDHKEEIQVAARKVESMEVEMEKIELEIQELSNNVNNKNEEIVITEDDMDESEKEMRSGKFKPEYWKLPHDDLYLKFIDGKIEDGKPLYENCGNDVYVRVADIKKRQATHGMKESTKPSTAKKTLFPNAERLMGENLKYDMNKEETKPEVTPDGTNNSNKHAHISTPDGQGGTAQLFSFDYYQFPKGHTRRLDTFKAGKVTLTDVSSTEQIISLYMQLQHNLTQHGILLPLDPNNIERWESQKEPPTVPYTLEDFDGDKAKYQHIRTHSATTIYGLLKETIDDDWVQGQNILLTEEQRCDGYALLYRLLALTMPKLRDIDDIHSLKEPIYTTSDTPVTFANKIGIWRQQKHYENEHMTESNCFTYLITRVPRELYEEGLTSIEKTYGRYKTDHNHWSIRGKHGQEPIYPRLCKLSEAGATIMNVQIAHNKKTGKTDAIVRKATSTNNVISPDQCMECVMDQSDNTPSFVPIIHAATARALARPRQDVVCRGCKQWGHCIELGGQCDFLAQTINCQHYIRNCKDKQKLKDAVINYDERQKDRRRIMAKTGSNGPTATRGGETTQPQRGRTFDRSRSPYSQRRPRTPSSVRGLAKSASGGGGTAVTFQEEDMPYGFDDSNVLFADDESYYDEGSNMDDSNHE